MPSLRLRIDQREQSGRVGLTLVLPDDTQVAGEVDASSFSGDWAPDDLAAKLNDTTQRQQAEAIGKGLFDRLFVAGSAVRAGWDALTLQQRLLPLELDVADSELERLPWELLWDDADRRPARIGGVLRRASRQAQPSTSSDWPFRILIIVGVDDEAIGAKKEVAALRQALIDFGRSIDIHVLSMPEGPDLASPLRAYQPHVVHFIGHGTYDLGKRRHCVVIEAPGGTWNWTTAGIREDLTAAECIPRLVFLNCCRSASERESTSSLQQAFSALGVPTVVAMQADVRGDHAATFSRAFYARALVEDATGGGAPAVPAPIVDAVQVGRRALGGEDDIDWGLPTLTFCRDVPVEYSLMKRREWPDDADFRRCREFDAARVYADASQARRTMIEWFYPVKPRQEPNILIVRGPTGSGKTRLLHWCMESWAADNPRQRYLAIDRYRGENGVKWLLRLRAGTLPADQSEGDRFLKQPLELTHFLPFYAAVARAAGVSLRDGDVTPEVDAIDSFKHEVADDVPSGPLCELFLQGLQQLGRIVIVFDQLSVTAIPPKLFAAFRDSFVTPVGSPAQSRVRIVLAMTAEDYEQFGLSGLKASTVKIIDLDHAYTTEQLQELAVEALRFRNPLFLRELAGLHLKLATTRRGLGRLEFCQQMLSYDDFRNLGRMK